MSIHSDYVLLFDLDGTLADTEGLAMEVTDRYFRRQGRVVPQSDLNYLVGTAWPAAVQYLLGRHPTGKDHDTTLKEILSDYREALNGGVKEIPGSAEAVRELSNHFKLGVVSGSNRMEIKTILSTLGILDRFQQYMGFEDYSKSKPHPEPYLEMLRRFPATASRVLVFEDSENGVRAAQAAGLAVVAVGNDPLAVKSRPATQWAIEDFRGIGAQWVRARFNP